MIHGLFLQALPDIAWGKRTRLVLDVGCGVASFGGFLFDRDVLTMSLAPKDEHEAQVQFALERGIPAISAVMGTQRLLFPGRVFDVVHCARCRVPWHIEGMSFIYTSHGFVLRMMLKQSEAYPSFSPTHHFASERVIVSLSVFLFLF